MITIATTATIRLLITMATTDITIATTSIRLFTTIATTTTIRLLITIATTATTATIRLLITIATTAAMRLHITIATTAAIRRHITVATTATMRLLIAIATNDITIATTAAIRRHTTIADPLFFVAAIVVGARVPPVTHTLTGVCALPDLVVVEDIADVVEFGRMGHDLFLPSVEEITAGGRAVGCGAGSASEVVFSEPRDEAEGEALLLGECGAFVTPSIVQHDKFVCELFLSFLSFLFFPFPVMVVAVAAARFGAGALLRFGVEGEIEVPIAWSSRIKHSVVEVTTTREEKAFSTCAAAERETHLSCQVGTLLFVKKRTRVAVAFAETEHFGRGETRHK